jgi:hypothetical protein
MIRLVANEVEVLGQVALDHLARQGCQLTPIGMRSEDDQPSHSCRMGSEATLSPQAGEVPRDEAPRDARLYRR